MMREIMRNYFFNAPSRIANHELLNFFFNQQSSKCKFFYIIIPSSAVILEYERFFEKYLKFLICGL